MAAKDRAVKASSPLQTFLDRLTLRRMAGARSFERSEDYFVNGQVEAIAEHKGAITAKVRGTRPYQVKLWVEKKNLEYSCTCPVGAGGEFCKQCVAAGVAWQEGSTSKGRQPKSKASQAVTMEDVRAHLAQAEWTKVPALGPGCDDLEKYGKRFRITHIMETLARQTGDVEAVVAVKKRDLSSAYDYLQVAETYKKAGKRDQALEWAERGIRACPERTDSRLREFLAEEYRRRKRHDDAMALIWAEFTESPSLEQYRVLKAHAERVGLASLRKRSSPMLRSTSARGSLSRGYLQRLQTDNMI